MPEGDTIHRAAAALAAALIGRELTAVGGTSPEVRRRADRLVGSTVTEVTAVGKHLLIHLEGDVTIRTHQGMSGSWRLYRPGEAWRRPAGAARVVLETAEWQAVCFAAPIIQVERRRVVERAVADLGPDVAVADFDHDEFLRRASTAPPDRLVADLLLDQQILAGVGNVYKAEVLFLEGIHPARPIATLGPAELGALGRRAHRLVRANLGGGRRTTTGDRRSGRETWVYGRAGRPCRRCGARIEEEWLGSPSRRTAWCPGCQPFSN